MLNWNCLKVTAPHFTVVIYEYVEPDLNLINASQTVKDLGVTMSNDCMFDQHIHNVVKRSSQLCGWILRTFQTRRALLMLILFKSIVLSSRDGFKSPFQVFPAK